MRKHICLALGALALATLPAGPAVAGWKLMSPGAAVVVAKGTLRVTPGEAWNRSSVRPIPKSELWTLDGALLNELYFVSDLLPGETLYRDAAKKDRPLPKLGGAMQLTDIPCVDAPSDARRFLEAFVARVQVLPCVRPD